MLFLVHMEVTVRPTWIRKREPRSSAGRRPTRRICSVTIDSNDELRQIISGLPLFTYMNVRVTPLATHPSDVNS